MQAFFLAIINWLDHNEGLAEWLTAIVALVALIYTVKDFFLKQRPFIDLEIDIAENPEKDQGGWLFFARLINKGTYPGVVKVEKTLMRIGDEEYPAEIKSVIFVSPGESKKLALIGSIFNTGVKKIRGNEYRNNRVEIHIKALSAKIGSKKLKYITELTYQVNVSGDKPVITMIEELYT